MPGALHVAVGAVLMLALGASDAMAQDTASKAVFERDAVEVQAPAGIKFDRVRIDNHLGNVSVRGHDHQSIAIQSYKHADDESTLERLVVSLVPDGRGQVSITTALRAGAENRPVRAGSIAVDLVVFVPRDSAIDAQIWSGQLEVSKVDNGATLLADKGRIEVKQVSGAVSTDIRLGDQAFAELFGELYTRSVEGSLSLDTVRGKMLDASVVRGGIVGEGLNVDAIKMRAVFGDIDLSAELIPGGSYNISSRKGNVSVRFHGQAAVSVKVLAHKSMLGSELAPKTDGEGRWNAHYGPRIAKSIPAELEVRAAAGTVVVRHF